MKNLLAFMISAILLLSLTMSTLHAEEETLPPTEEAEDQVIPVNCLQKTNAGVHKKAGVIGSKFVAKPCAEFDPSMKANISNICMYHNGLWHIGRWDWKKVGTARFIPTAACDEGIEYKTIPKESAVHGPKLFDQDEVTLSANVYKSKIAGYPGKSPIVCYTAHDKNTGASQGDLPCNPNPAEPNNKNFCEFVPDIKGLTNKGVTIPLKIGSFTYEGGWFVYYKGVYTGDYATDIKIRKLCLGGAKLVPSASVGITAKLNPKEVNTSYFPAENENVSIQACFLDKNKTASLVCNQNKCTDLSSGAGCCRYLKDTKGGATSSWYYQQAAYVKEKVPLTSPSPAIFLDTNIQEHMDIIHDKANYLGGATASKFRKCQKIRMLVPDGVEVPAP